MEISHALTSETKGLIFDDSWPRVTFSYAGAAPEGTGSKESGSMQGLMIEEEDGRLPARRREEPAHWYRCPFLSPRTWR
jgi:hypothetical protein